MVKNTRAGGSLDPADWLVERTFDPSLHEELPRLLGRSSIDALLEFVCNGYDADATRVDIQYDAAKKTLTITDDGEGMAAPEKLRGFYTRGGSSKRKNPVTARGRHKVGKYGLAASLLPYLAESSVLETAAAGVNVVIAENYTATQAGQSVPAPTVSSTSSEIHGTTITLNDLKRPIDLDKLVERLAREAPRQDDFKVYVNGQEVLLPKIDRAQIFVMDEEVPGVGRVYGELYLSSVKLITKGGVYLKVNGRAVGDPQHFMVSGAVNAAAMSQRILAFIHADGLDAHISFDRTRFDEDEPHVIAVKERVAAFLTTVRRSYDAIIKEERRKKQVGQYHAVVGAVETRFNRADKNFLPRGECTFELTQEGDRPYPVEIDTTARKVYVHTDHPFFIGMRNPNMFRTALISATAMAFARARVKYRNAVPEPSLLDTAFGRSFQILHDQGLRLRHVLYGTPEASPFAQPETIELARLYPLEELVSSTWLSKDALREMIDAGVLLQAAKPTLTSGTQMYVSGRSIQGAVDKMMGQALLADVVRAVFPQLTSDQHYEVAADVSLLLKRDRSMDEHVVNIGVNRPFYVVKGRSVPVFQAYLRENAGIATFADTYGELSGRRPVFAFSVRVPREQRDHPEQFIDSHLAFLRDYMKSDSGARARLFYLPEEGRVVGTVLSFEGGLLHRTFGDRGFQRGDHLPHDMHAAEFAHHSAAPAGTFSVEQGNAPAYLKKIFAPAESTAPSNS